jgi:death-on-curing protein
VTHGDVVVRDFGLLALAGVIAFYGMNGRRLTLTNEAAYQLVMRVAKGDLDQVADIAALLTTEPRA